MRCLRLLAIDTSTERLVAALDGQAGAVLTVDEAGGARASSRLLPAVQQLLADAGLAIAELDAIAFGRGPGAFTGLRTACAVAQGLALGAGKLVLPVDSLLVVAEDARRQAALGGGSLGAPFEVAVAMDARMGEAYAARYRHDGRRWQALQPPALWTLDALADDWRLRPPAQRAGSALTAFADRLCAGLGAGQGAFAHEADRARALHALAHAAWQDGLAVDAALALPLYLRDKVALTTAEREAVRAAAAEDAGA